MNAEIHQLKPRAIAVNWMCSACGTDAACNCGAPLMSKAQRAVEAVAAEPRKSDRAIAAELGVDHKTVGAARRTGERSPVDDEPRVGRDGKARRMPARRENIEVDEDNERAAAEHNEGLRVIAARGFLNRAAEAKEIATIGKLRASDVTEAMIKAAEDAAAAWSKQHAT